MESRFVINARFLTQKITGVQRFAIEQALLLKKFLPNAEFVSSRNIIHKDLALQLNVKVIGSGLLGHVWEQVALPIYLSQNGNPILINLCNTAPLIYRRNVLVIHDLGLYHHPEWFSKSFIRYYKFLIPRLIKNCLQIVTVSNYSRQDLSRVFRLNSSSIQVLYQSISPSFKGITPINKVNPYGNYILSVSSIDPRKNLIGLVKAFKSAHFDDLKLVLVGTRNKIFANDELSELVKDDSSIVFTGYVTDEELINLYQQASLFAFPTFFEGFGIPPLEAMACGCPTVVSAVASLPEVCGNASWYIDPTDYSSIQVGLEKVLSDEILRQELIIKGYERVQYFTGQESIHEFIYKLGELT
jgi:glycosyltransferase involved in cell wall biosynthesis